MRIETDLTRLEKLNHLCQHLMGKSDLPFEDMVTILKELQADQTTNFWFEDQFWDFKPEAESEWYPEELDMLYINMLATLVFYKKAYSEEPDFDQDFDFALSHACFLDDVEDAISFCALNISYEDSLSRLESRLVHDFKKFAQIPLTPGTKANLIDAFYCWPQLTQEERTIITPEPARRLLQVAEEYLQAPMKARNISFKHLTGSLLALAKRETFDIDVGLDALLNDRPGDILERLCHEIMHIIDFNKHDIDDEKLIHQTNILNAISDIKAFAPDIYDDLIYFHCPIEKHEIGRTLRDCITDPHRDYNTALCTQTLDETAWLQERFEEVAAYVGRPELAEEMNSQRKAVALSDGFYMPVQSNP